jgi:hypothetical protein
MKKRNPFSPIRTKHPGVFYILGTGPDGKSRRTFYIQYYREGKRQKLLKMSVAVANGIRADKIRGEELPNKERREAERAEKAAHDSRWTIGKLAEALPGGQHSEDREEEADLIMFPTRGTLSFKIRGEVKA